MARIELIVGRAGRGSRVPLDAAGLARLARTFRAASGGAIELDATIDPVIAVPAAADVASYHLHDAAARLTGNTPGQGRVRRIALIFANSYRARADAFGVMFDNGFATYDDPSDDQMLTATPREGCAVFLDPILAMRDPAGEEARQILYTAIHELGHVFNLTHRTGENFMSQSPGGRDAPADAAWNFDPDDQSWLADADSDEQVWPGGAPYRDRSDALDRPRRAHRLRLSLSIARKAFAFNEPVELDIRLSVPRSAGPRPVRIPDEIDPGYARFQLWIEDPDGERRLYRPINHYCPGGRSFSLSPGKPFARDLSIFGQSGGFTFSKRGIHRVWATLQIGRTLFRSRDVSFEITPPARAGTLAGDLMKRSKVQAFFFYRYMKRLQDVEMLAEAASGLRSRELHGALRYALARYYWARRRDRRTGPDFAKRGKEQAARALERHDVLGSRQVYHAETIIDG